MLSYPRKISAGRGPPGSYYSSAGKGGGVREARQAQAVGNKLSPKKCHQKNVTKKNGDKELVTGGGGGQMAASLLRRWYLCLLLRQCKQSVRGDLNANVSFGLFPSFDG